MEELKWQAPDEEGLKTFLTENKGFSETTFVNAINKFKKCKGKSNQKRLDSFFTIGTKKSTSNITPVVKPSKGKGRKK